MAVDRVRLCGKRAREDEPGPESSPMPLDPAEAQLVPYVPIPPPAVPHPEGSELDDMDEDPEPQGPSQVEVSETLCRRTMVRASKAGTVVAEQRVSQREVSVSSPQEQIRVSEERELRALHVSVNGSSGPSGSSCGEPSTCYEAAQIARRTLRLDMISGAVDMDEEELSRWRVVADRVVQGGPEPEAWGPMGETLLQPGEGPSSQCPGDDPVRHGRPGLTGSPVPQLPASSVLLLEDRAVNRPPGRKPRGRQPC